MIKKGVQLNGLQPQMCIAYTIANTIYQSYGYQCWITSGSDSKHADRSRHYEGKALDIRIRNIEVDAHKQRIANEIDTALGDEFDVILKSDHIHIEYDPKRTKPLL